MKTAKSPQNVPMFNAWTYGNVLQMWIRHPDGTAEVGIYKVTYDYDPATKKLHAFHRSSAPAARGVMKKAPRIR